MRRLRRVERGVAGRILRGATLDMGDEYMLNSIAVVVLGGSNVAGGTPTWRGS